MIDKAKNYIAIITNFIEVVDNRKIAAFGLFLVAIIVYLLYLLNGKDLHIDYIHKYYQNKIESDKIINREDLKECNHTIELFKKDAEMWRERYFQYLEKREKKK